MKMKYLPLATSGSLVSAHNFWNSILLYHNRPQVINRKIIGTSASFIYKIDFNSRSIKLKELITHAGLLYEVRKLSEITEKLSYDLIKGLLEPYDKAVVISKVSSQFMKESSDGAFISLRRLLPKQSKNFCIELVLLDKDDNIVTFCAAEDSEYISAPPFPYHLESTSTGHVRLLIENFDDAETPSAEWLVDKLFNKLIKWAQEYSDEVLTEPSIKLVDMEQYSELYKNLKEKYGQQMVKIWPENTDPLKFVYEDVAIAAYLISLWMKLSPGRKPSFVDLGCGNGLLVYILNQEGYTGFGIDVRKRKIWDLYPENVKLEVRTIIPSAEHLFPNSDWIIGNHSDELTPWIPVISFRSSFKTNFFLLPCCTYDFSGKKYNRKDTSKSQYGEYLEYVEDICNKCEFKTERDKLRIPSTKKTCIVSLGRTCTEDKVDSVNARITEFINMRCGQSSDKISNNIWSQNFQPRADTEIVRNCTKLERSLINKIVQNVVSSLLVNENFVHKLDGGSWNCGQSISLCDLIKLLDKEDLKKLKKECGGLQTLLRNHRYIFEVIRGTVKLRQPARFEDLQKFKSKQCWFHLNHPQGCLHNSTDCAYNHNC